MSITLPNDMADIIKTKVQGGEYASESEVIRDGVRALLARDRRHRSLASSSCRIGLRRPQSRSLSCDLAYPVLDSTVSFASSNMPG